MTNKSKKVFLTAFLMLGFFFAAEAQAVAPLVMLGAIALVPLILSLITTVFSVAAFLNIVGPIAKFAGQLIDWAISFQNILLEPEKITAIQTTWGMLRDFVNIFFILILLVIAFATIFNIKNYKASDLLPKLIIIALLINFSLVVTAWVIDLLWVPAAIFLKPLGEGVSLKIANALDTEQFFNPNFLTLIATGGISHIVQEIFRAVLLVVNAFLLSWIALILWARIPILIGLMIVSPVAWLGYTVPAIRKQSWDVWWQKLFCWGAIPIPLFGLIYFVVLFHSRLTVEMSQAIPGSWWNTVLSFLGLNISQTLVWLITVGIFVGGLMYIKGLSCSMYGWMKTGAWGLWGGIRGGIGRAVDFGYAATGAAGAAKGIKGRILEAGLFGGGGVAGRQAREERIEDRLAGWAGLEPKYRADVGTLERAGKAEKDIENKLSRVHTKGEEDKIIAELKTKVEKGTKDPETLAAINTLAKRGQLDAVLFNQTVNNFKDMPLAINGVFAKWKEGKFGGISLDQFLGIMRDKDDKLNLDARRTMYNFAASDDGKKIAEKMGAYTVKDERGNDIDITDYKAGYEILGMKDKRDFSKKVGGARPDLKADYIFNVVRNNTEHQDYEGWTKTSAKFQEITGREVEDIKDIMFMAIKDASAKDLSDINPEVWKKDEFKQALKMAFEERAKISPEAAANLKIRLERRLIDEGGAEQLRVLHETTTASRGLGRIITPSGETGTGRRSRTVFSETGEKISEE